MQKIAVISGTTRGIGYAIAQLLLSQNWIVIGIARSPSTIQHVSYYHFQADIRNWDELQNRFNQITQKFPSFHALINNAGIGHYAYTHETDPEIWKILFEVNVHGAFYLTKLALPIFLKQKHGHIINIASVAALDGYPGISAYCATKAALRNFSYALFKEYRKEGIKVTIIYPGSVETPFFENVPELNITANKLTPQDVAESVVYSLNTSSNNLPLEIQLRPLQP